LPESAKRRRNKKYKRKNTTAKSLTQLTTLGTVIILLNAGCATIVSKSDWPITFSSNPAGAEIIITDKDGREIHRGTTPTTLTLHPSSAYFSAARYDVEVRLAGYNVGKGSVSAKMNGWYLGNIVFGGLVGLLIVDPVTGAMFKLPKEYIVNLTKTTASAPEERVLRIVNISDVPTESRAKLVRLD